MNRVSYFLTTMLITALSAGSASAQTLPSFKDDLFAYPGVLAVQDNDAYSVIDYQEARDINQRDEVPERRVRKAYVSLGVKSQQREVRVERAGGQVRAVAVGKEQNASLIVLYLHGQGGNRHQGVNDFTFGGNFNRVKNLVVKAGGLYLSPDFSDFGERGVAQIGALIAHFSKRSPGAPVVVACGSMGGMLCWRLAQDGSVASRLGGLLMLGSLWDDAFISSAAYKRNVPVFFAHGSRDTVFDVERQEAFYRKVRGKSGTYPARFVRFETGTHGTPIRMVDWRGALNWMLEQ